MEWIGITTDVAQSAAEELEEAGIFAIHKGATLFVPSRREHEAREVKIGRAHV